MRLLARLLTTTCLLFAATLLPACGGGGETGGSSEGTVAGGSDTPIPGTPPADPTPPVNPPVDPPPVVPPPVVPPPIDPVPPVNPPPAGPVPPTPLPVLKSHDGFENVACLTVDPQTDTVYALRKGTGELLILAPGQADVQSAGTIAALAPATGMAFHPTQQMIFVVLDGGAGNDDTLHTLAVDNQAEVEVGTITGHRGIESIAFREDVLYAVDGERNLLLRLDITSATPTEIGALGDATQDVRGLIYDAGNEQLLAVDTSNDACVIIDTDSGTARLGATLREGALRGLAYASGTGTLYGVSASQLKEVDPRGSWIDGGDIRALAADVSQGVLYGIHKGFGLLIDIQPESGWKQPIGVVADNGIEGLAFDPSGPHLYAISNASNLLYRIVPTDATTETVGLVGGVTNVASLAFAAGGLYGVDVSSMTLFRIDPATAVAVSTSPILGHAGVRSLTFDPDRDALLAYADSNTTLFSIQTAAGSPSEIIDDTLTIPQVGGLAWLDGRVLGTDLANRELVTLEEPAPTGLGFDAVHALAVNDATQEVVGCDVLQHVTLTVDVASGTASERRSMGTSEIEGMAFDRLDGSFLLADKATGTLMRMGSDGSWAAIGAPGNLGQGIRALAHVPSATPVLLGFDVTAGSFVSIDLATGAATALGAVDPTLDVQAMTFDADTARVIALDRSTGNLMEVDPTTGGIVHFAQVGATDVRAMGIAEGTAALILVDASLDEIVLVDRFTGDVIVQQSKLGVHRGAADTALATLVWPRGDVRLEALRSVALAVSDEYEGAGVLEFRSEKYSYKHTLAEPSRFTSLIPVAKALTNQCRPGDSIECTLFGKNGKKLASSTFRIVKRPDVQAKLARMEASPYFRKHSAAVRELVAVRTLQRHGLHSESLARSLHASIGSSIPKVWTGAIATSLRALATADENTIAWDAGPLVRWLARNDKDSTAARALLKSR